MMKRYLVIIIITLLLCLVVFNRKTGENKEEKGVISTARDGEVIYSDTTDRLELFQPVYNSDVDIVDTRLIGNYGGSHNKWKAHMAVQIENNTRSTPCWQLCNFVKLISVDITFDQNGDIVTIKPRREKEKAVIYDGDYIIVVGDDGYSHPFGVLGPLCTDKKHSWSPCFSQDNGLMNETKNEQGQTVIDWNSPELPPHRYAIHKLSLFDRYDDGPKKPLMKGQPFSLQFIKFSDNSSSPFDGQYLNIMRDPKFSATCNTGKASLFSLLGYWSDASNYSTSTFVLKDSSVQQGLGDGRECQNCSAQFTTPERSNLC